MKRYIPLIALLLIMGFGCEECDRPDPITEMFRQVREQQEREAELYTPPTNSILEDLYPEQYGNSNTTTIEEGSIEIPNLTFDSYWVNQTDLDYTSSGTEAYWQVQVVNGNDTQSFDIPAISIDITAEFRGSNTETVTATTDANGWATWTRPKGHGAEQMYITDIGGDYPWNSLDMDFWQTTPALSITAEEAQ